MVRANVAEYRFVDKREDRIWRAFLMFSFVIKVTCAQPGPEMFCGTLMSLGHCRWAHARPRMTPA